MVRVNLEFLASDYTSLDNSTVEPLGLTEREGAIIASALPLLLYRDVWIDISDAEWDSLQATISDLIEEIQSTI